MIDKQIGNYVADFEQDLTDKIDQAFTDRLDHLIETEERMNEHVEEAKQAVKINNETAKNLHASLGNRYLINGIIGGGWGGHDGICLMVTWCFMSFPFLGLWTYLSLKNTFFG